MKKILTLSFSLLILFLLNSCNKNDIELDGETGALIGNWKFIELNVKSTIDLTITDGGETQRTVSRSNYTTSKNGGQLNINGTKFTLNDLEYTVNATVTAETFYNGMSIGDQELPFEFTLPKYASVTEYKAIGNDSLHFTSGTFITTPGVTSNAGSGARYVIEGNKLTIVTKIDLLESKPYPGYPSATMLSKTNAIGTMVFER